MKIIMALIVVTDTNLFSFAGMGMHFATGNSCLLMMLACLFSVFMLASESVCDTVS